MDTTPDLKLMGVTEVNGQPLACGGCGNTFSLEVHRHLVLETAPAWISCLSCGRGEDSPTVTNGLVDAALAARTGRARAEDRDLFTAQWRGIVMTGELVPELVMDDMVTLAELLKRETTKTAKAWGRAQKREAKALVKVRTDALSGAVRDRARSAVGGAKAAALGAAWQLQTGGAGPAKSVRPKQRRCRVKGCKRGMLTIKTRVHSTTGKTQTVKVPCAVCGRTGGGK
ncbi:hypothetical protein GT030_29655 [Streptomyces sp. SID1328]|uniref:hypothetical protein n=1 Tax=Streptomyces sp. SID1328 TaxID=2690250 RepID=UPI0013721B6B|nr:hypothetical protein [Streptomyces sp. SID1328]MYV42920.1 hypothetical protein [Streptomyces sp. SID1328]